MSQDLLVSFLTKLNALTGGVFLLCAFGLVGIRQMLTCLRIYVFQSLLLAVSAIFSVIFMLRFTFSW
jgi:hypothetical protein